MSLMNVRNILRCSRYLVEQVKPINSRKIAPSYSVASFNVVSRFFADQASKVNSKKQEIDPVSPASTAENIGKSGTETERNLKSEIEKLNETIFALTEKAVTLEDKYKRSLAESENLRIRLTKQIEDAKLFGIQNFCKDLLEVADILNKATESVPKEEINEKNPHLKSLYEGLVMTEAQLQRVFKRHGLEQVNPIDQPFDPNLHEALFQQEVPGKTAGTVVIVSKIGYKLHDRCIRPALVGVAKG